MTKEQKRAVKIAVAELCNVDAHMQTERIPAARALAEAFGLPFGEDADDDEEVAS